MANIIVREYNAESGALLGNLSTLNFGRITSGTTSSVKVIDVVFSDVTAVGNIKLGLISSAGITVNTNPGAINPDQSSTNGHFGIEHTPLFDETKASSGLKAFFAGINTTITSDNSNNVIIYNRNATTSDYIYLSIQIGAGYIGSGNGAYKLFFDFS